METEMFKTHSSWKSGILGRALPTNTPPSHNASWKPKACVVCFKQLRSVLVTKNLTKRKFMNIPKSVYIFLPSVTWLLILRPSHCSLQAPAIPLASCEATGLERPPRSHWSKVRAWDIWPNHLYWNHLECYCYGAEIDPNSYGTWCFCVFYLCCAYCCCCCPSSSSRHPYVGPLSDTAANCHSPSDMMTSTSTCSVRSWTKPEQDKGRKRMPSRQSSWNCLVFGDVHWY